VDSATPFTEWVRNGAKEKEWQRFLRDQEEKESREARKRNDRLLKKLKESGIEWEKLFEKPANWVCFTRSIQASTIG